MCKDKKDVDGVKTRVEVEYGGKAKVLEIKNEDSVNCPCQMLANNC